MASSEEIKKENQKKLALQKKFEQRITIARQGREAFLSKDYITATKKYNEYLSILAESKNIEDIFKLAPTMFDPKRHITEMLLISHVYWELARINEMTPKLQKNFSCSLNQFVKFTVNQPYQVLNSEMLRKYIKKNKRTSPQLAMLNQALSQIHVQSKKCFIATECFGEEDIVTNTLRSFKREMILWPFGVNVVELYYRVSTKLLKHKAENKIYAKVFIILSKRPLRLFAKFTQTSIFKRCSYYLKSLQKSGSNH